MMLGLSFRVSWISLLLFSTAAAFPATKGDYRYPYSVSSWGSSGGSAHGSNLPDTSRRPLLSLQHEAAPQQASSGSQSTSGVGVHTVAAGSSQGPAGNTATTFDFGPAPYAAPEAAYPSAAGSPGATAFRMDGPVPYAAHVPYPYAGPGLPWDEQPAGGADASFSDPSNWMPSRSFPDFSAWDSDGEMQQGGMQQGASETSPLPPSSYIIQSSNGYQRAREVLSHTKYSPEYPEPPVMAFRAEAPRKSPPMTGSKGGWKV